MIDNKEKKSEEIWKRAESQGFVGEGLEPKENPCKSCRNFKLYGIECWYYWDGKVDCSMREEEPNEKRELEKRAD